MLEILFASPKEARTIYTIFRSIRKEFLSELQLINDELIKISPKSWDVSLEQFVIPGMIEFILEYKEHQLMVSMLKEDYYFVEEIEQQQILQIASSIIEGERTDIPNIQGLRHRDEVLKETLWQFLRPNLNFSFSSFQKFRLHQYNARLREYVEVAIEEYKLEQEYQTFIQSLRDYHNEQKSKLEVVSIVHKEGYVVYDADEKRISEDQLKNYVDKSFIHQHTMYVDSNLLAPLVSISPKTILVYTNNSLDGMIQTIQNIFQEKVSIHSLAEFTY
ncbi:putative sporulation protein YtxC [Metabacillus litoralis]|uniref:putative sporulation protein YtxC n=1 Tax=Metabacillus litoralis TaxID=152268 RepID=UPI001CFE21B7|nr:putative sporulation protein YtxC [Metabacillus litoralis]